MRWIKRILITLVIVLLIAVAAIQAVLWSDWPRREALARLQHETGLVIDAKSIRTGWFGRTVLRDVSVRLPLATQPLADIPQMRIEHTALAPMLLFGRMDVRAVEANNPRVHAVEDDTGAWNVQRLVDAVAARQGHRGSSDRTARLPTVVIRNAQINITNRAGETLALPAANFTGRSHGLLEWTFQGAAPPLVETHGRLAAAPGAPHEIHARLNNVENLLNVLTGQSISNSASGELTWSGIERNGTLTGRLNVRHVTLGDYSMTGAADVSFDGGAVVVNQPQLTMTRSGQTQAPVHLAGGRATLRDGVMDLQQAHIHAFDASASLQVRLDLNARQGQIDSSWSGQRDELHLSYRGSLAAQIHWPKVGTRRLNVAMHSSGAWAEGEWTAAIDASASGPSWGEMSGRLAWPTLTARMSTRRVELSGLAAAVSVNWPRVRLDDLSLPSSLAQGAGSIDVQSREWSIALALKKWTLPISGEVMSFEPLDVSVDARGSPLRVDVAALDVRSGPLEVHASGTYVPADDQPLAAQALVKASFRGKAAPEIAAVAAATPAQNPAPVSTPADLGAIEAHLQLRGRLQPVALEFTGEMTGRNLPVGHGKIDHALVPLRGHASSSHVVFESQRAALLDGLCALHGSYQMREHALDLQVDADGASLKQLADLAGSKATFDGRVHGEGRVVITLGNDFNIAVEDALWHAEQVRTPAGVIAHGMGQLRGSRGVFEFRDVVLTSPGDPDPGFITGSATYSSATGWLTTDSNFSAWPWREANSGAGLRVSGPVKLHVQLATGQLAGSATLQSTLDIGGHRAGDMRADLTADDHLLHLANIHAQLWNGEISGNASIALDQPTRSRVQLQWRDIDSAAIEAYGPTRNMLSGRVSGTASIQPSEEPRALGPMRFEVAVQSHDLHSRSVTIGDLSATGYLGPNLLIADQASIRIADGDLRVWGRLSRHGNDPFAHFTATFERLDLNQLVHWVDPDEDVVPGRISGSASGGGYLKPVGDSHRLFGQSDLALVESDLVNITLFTLIHDALSLSLGDMQPHGDGKASIRLEGNMLELSRLEYYNRGTDVVASVRIEDIRLRGRSPINGVAVGAMRPLKKLSVPFFKDFDRAIKALQTGAASVRIGGTLETPEQKLVPFAEIAGAFERILTGSPN